MAETNTIRLSASQPELHLRVATVEEDIPLLADLNRQLIQDEGHRNPMTLPELAERMRQWLQRGDYTAVIIELDGLPVAYALYRDEPAAIHLRHFFVDRRHRRRGLGRRAMALLLNHHWAADKRVTVDVLVDNAAGRAFWRAVGFREYAVRLELTRP